jgi:DNA-binding MarR family transcriptional regulator
MPSSAEFELREFLPYLLNQAAEQASLGFRRTYRDRYGMLRTEWRVLAHLGGFGPQTASQIVSRAALHKTKISRAVRALEARRFLERHEDDADRRSAVLHLTHRGQAVYAELAAAAQAYDAALAARFPPEDQAALRRCLRTLAGFDGG